MKSDYIFQHPPIHPISVLFAMFSTLVFRVTAIANIAAALRVAEAHRPSPSPQQQQRCRKIDASFTTIPLFAHIRPMNFSASDMKVRVMIASHDARLVTLEWAAC
jgi:hypothetical protein